MIPIQDVVPSGRRPLVTVALICINIVVFVISRLSRPSDLPVLLGPFDHTTAAHLVVACVFLWLFGDNIEARLGRAGLALLYIICGFAGAWVATLSAAPHLLPPIGAACAVSGVMGAYFVILPASRILVMVPAPVILTEVPALFFLGMWGLFHAATFALPPSALPPVMGGLLASLALGAAVAFVARRPVRW